MAEREAAPAVLSRKQDSGRSRATVRPYYEGLPLRGLDAGRMKAGGSLPDKGANALVRPRKHGPANRNRRGGAPKGVRASALEARAAAPACAAEVMAQRLSALCPLGFSERAKSGEGRKLPDNPRAAVRGDDDACRTPIVWKNAAIWSRSLHRRCRDSVTYALPP